MKTITLVTSLVLAALILEPPAASKGTPPNILLIMADDMGYECVRSNGGTDYDTPHLDALDANRTTEVTRAIETILATIRKA